MAASSKPLKRSVLDKLTKRVNGISEAGVKRFGREYDRLAAKYAVDGSIPSESVAPFRDELVKLMDEVCGASAESAASAAAAMYDEARNAAIGAPLGFGGDAKRKPIATERAVRSFVASAAEAGGIEVIRRRCVERIDYEAKRASAESAVACGFADRRRPRFARVPTGAETCEFCLMLASRGAVYLSARRAGAVEHFHANCDCRVVPAWTGDPWSVDIEGYDPASLYDEWRGIEDARAKRRAEANGTTQEFEHAQDRARLSEAADRGHYRNITENAAEDRLLKTERKRSGGGKKGGTPNTPRAWLEYVRSAETDAEYIDRAAMMDSWMASHDMSIADMVKSNKS